jgi:hypothetical protein
VLCVVSSSIQLACWSTVTDQLIPIQKRSHDLDRVSASFFDRPSFLIIIYQLLISRARELPPKATASVVNIIEKRFLKIKS